MLLSPGNINYILPEEDVYLVPGPDLSLCSIVKNQRRPEAGVCSGLIPVGSSAPHSLLLAK